MHCTDAVADCASDAREIGYHLIATGKDLRRLDITLLCVISVAT